MPTSPLNRAQREACALAETARSQREHEQAHRAMQRAFPGIARAFPCDCAGCRPRRVEAPPEPRRPHR
jgi:hypothetical protein